MSQIGHLYMHQCPSEVQIKLRSILWFRAHVDRPIEFPSSSNSPQMSKSQFTAMAANVMSNGGTCRQCECASRTDWTNSNSNFRFDFLSTASLEFTNVYNFHWMRLNLQAYSLHVGASICTGIFLEKIKSNSRCVIRWNYPAYVWTRLMVMINEKSHPIKMMLKDALKVYTRR